MRLLIPSLVLLLSLVGSPAAEASYQLFEAGPVRPLALSPDGSLLAAANTPDDRVELFAVQPDGSLVEAGSVPVGMRPVALAFRTNDELWVVNHLSDSVSVVDLASTPHVARTLLVGDEPRDIVFAGTGGNRAFVSTARRGQHRTDPSIAAVPGAGDPLLTTEGIGRADVWVFDATTLGNTVGATPVEILSFFADTPRGLAVSPDGNTVYLAAFHSGNQTTTIGEPLVPDGFGSAGPSGGAPGGAPGPDDNAAGDPAPETGVIVRYDGASWRDTLGRSWDALVPFDLPDHDVFSIDANTLAPGSVAEFDHVGTILFNIGVNPVSGKLYVTNTESPNEVLFEGPGDHGGSTVQGHLSESRITVIDPAGPSVSPKHLNQHIDYSLLHTTPGVDHIAIEAQIPHSLATPLQPVVSSDGTTLYVAAFGSARVGVFPTSAIEDPSFATNFDPTTASAAYIATGGGPSGLALNEGADRLYVLTRFANQLEVVDLTAGSVIATHALHDVEDATITPGRRFLYDAAVSSGNGEASCASCHIFGDMDDLAWNLGDPDLAVSANTQPSSSVLPPSTTLHPMKGPMTTQTLRGMATHGALHWRGDRVDGFFGLDPCTEPTGAPCDEDLSFNNFIVAFEGLLGKHGTISSAEMQQFTDFALQLRLPPNPVAELDGSLTTAQQDGSDRFFGPVTDTVETCNGCHDLDPAQGFFGTAGEQSFEGEPQFFKVAHMRNLYAKVGMFFAPGDQVRGFGFLHDGSVDTVKTFLEAPVFSTNDAEELDLEEFSLAFPSDLAPIVGQQVTLTASNDAAVDPRIDVLIARSAASFDSLVLGGTVTECDLIVKGTVGGAPRGWLREPGGLFRDDLGNTIADAALRALAISEGPLTYTCVPPGSGQRTGIDRDEDTLLDGVETNTGVFVSASDTGSNPALADTDGDGFDDAAEVNAAPPTDPNDENDFPGGPSVPALPLAGFVALAATLGAAGALRRRATAGTPR